MEPKDYYTAIGQRLADAEESQMFGKPCFKVNGKAFTCFFQDSMVFKLTADTRTDALALNGAVLFDPSGKGRPMKEWVQVPFEHRDKWETDAQAALDFVISSTL